MSLLLSHTWPGNVRELRNAIEHACVTGTSGLILPHDLPDDILRRPRFITTPTLSYKAASVEAKKQIIVNAFIQAGGSYTRTARVLDIKTTQLSRLIRRKNLKGTLDRTSIVGNAERVSSTATVTSPTYSTRTVGETVSHYRIIRKIGEGGMGVVYKAEDTRLDRIVAIKFPSQLAPGSEEQKVRFLRGAKAAAALNHPNICTTYDLGEADGQPFIVMEYVEGETLRQKTKRSPLKLEEALHLAIEIGRGLEAAHRKGIVHRDIKSSNIMIMPDGQPKITDFGLAQLGDESRITLSGTALGTPAYMSPEQARGETVNERADIWALGVVLYETIAGHLPFRGEGGQAVLYSVLNEEPEPLTALRSGLPLEVQRVVEKALAKDAVQRYRHIGEMIADLKAVQDGAESAVRSTGASTGWPRRFRGFPPTIMYHRHVCALTPNT